MQGLRSCIRRVQVLVASQGCFTGTLARQCLRGDFQCVWPAGDGGRAPDGALCVPEHGRPGADERVLLSDELLWSKRMK